MTRRSQPYRKGARQPGSALHAMLRGRAANAPHPKDPEREMYRRARRYRHR